MSFKDLDIKDLYQTDSDNIPEDFYETVLPEAQIYKRAAGFFSSSSLKMMGRGLKAFYKTNGIMQIAISPQLSKEDYKAICDGVKAQEDIALQKIYDALSIDEICEDEGCNILAWLIYEGRLEIRIIIKKDKNAIGIFHDKFSVIEDHYGNKITFRGSMNEGETAFVENFETIEVDNSWDSGVNRTIQREKQFDDIWSSQTKKWEAKKMPEALKERIIKIRKPIYDNGEMITPVDPTLPIEVRDENPRLMKGLELRDYQKNAIASWFKNDMRGILEMATGTGKTVTSISAITKLINIYNDKNHPCGLVITVPYIVLLEQWTEELEKFNIHTIGCYDSKSSWYGTLKKAIDLFNSGEKKNFCAIVTNATFTSDSFQDCLKSIKNDYILLADEMHHLASDKSLQSLPSNAKYRLGLSATLMKKFAAEKMDKLKDYFGGVVFTFDMGDAIRANCLTHYKYYPVFVELTDNERDEYYTISEKISKLVAMRNGEIDEEDKSMEALLSQRARLIASAENKLGALTDLKDVIVGTEYNLFYCGDKIEANERFIEKVTDVLNNDIGITTVSFTAASSKKQRQEILKRFEDGQIDSLTAIRCLDEGVDIPKLKRAFILSSGTNPKEFIQRRGRVLRKYPGKEYAEIYDFVVFPSLDPKEISQLTPDIKAFQKKIIAREYERFQEFADLADNGVEAYNQFINMWELYN